MTTIYQVLYTASVANGHEVGSGFDAEVVSDGRNAVLSLYNVPRKTWSMCELAEAPQSDADAKRIAIEAASCPGQWGAVTEDEDAVEFDRLLAMELAIIA